MSASVSSSPRSVMPRESVPAPNEPALVQDNVVEVFANEINILRQKILQMEADRWVAAPGFGGENGTGPQLPLQGNGSEVGETPPMDQAMLEEGTGSPPLAFKLKVGGVPAAWVPSDLLWEPSLGSDCGDTGGETCHICPVGVAQGNSSTGTHSGVTGFMYPIIHQLLKNLQQP